MSVEPAGSNATSVTGAIRQAAQQTGTSFNYLLATAKIESNLNPNAKAESSTAGGLFQFIEQTWLGTLKHAGPALGYGQYADGISKNSYGQYEVRDPALRQKILGLRSDPAANALMAGALTKSNGEHLASRLGRNASEGELYLAHFLGAAGASKLISLAGTSPQASAADVFPRAAGANRSIFYGKDGAPRSIAQVYDMMVGRHNVARARTTVPAAVSGTVASNAPGPVASTSMKAFSPSYFSTLPTTALPTVPALSLTAEQRPAADAGPVFYGLFKTGERPAAVSPVVTALWGAQPPTPPAQGPTPVNNPSARFGGTLDLFRDNG
jgi:hypothetical protein